MVEETIVDCQDDYETSRESMMVYGVELESCEPTQVTNAFIQYYNGLASRSNDPEMKAFAPIFIAVLELYGSGTSLEDTLSSKDLDEAFNPALEYVASTLMDANVGLSNGDKLLTMPPLGAGLVPFLWACAGEREYEWALNYKGLEGRFCSEGEDRIKYNNDLRDLEWISNEFSEPWIAFNCTKFDGCGLDDFYIADLLFEDPDIEDQLSPQRGGLRFDIDDFGLCRRAISGERLCVLNSHIILFKGAYQQGQTRQRLTLN